MYFIVQGLSGGRPGCANPNLSSWWIEGDLKVFKRVTSKCLTSMYAFTCRFPKSTVGGFFVFIDRYPCIRALRRLVWCVSCALVISVQCQAGCQVSQVEHEHEDIVCAVQVSEIPAIFHGRQHHPSGSLPHVLCSGRVWRVLGGARRLRQGAHRPRSVLAVS